MPRHRRPDPSSARSWIALLALCCAAGAAGPLLAQPLSAGPEIQVNSYTTGLQGVPRVASTPDGAFVVAWGSFGSIGPDDDGSSVQVRRYDADGEPLGNQLQVNAYTTGTQWYPDVWLRGDGQFVVTWQTQFSAGDPSGSSIQARRYSANGTPLGGQFQVNTYTTGDATSPRVAGDVAGNFVVVWASAGSSGTDTDATSIQARRYAADGTPLGGEFQVNSYTTSYQSQPDVTVADGGGFVVVWASNGSSGTDHSGYSVQAQRYAANGAPQGPQFQVNNYTTADQAQASVASDTAGDFVIAWSSFGSFGGDSDPGSIHAQRYAANGAAQGGQFQVNTYTTDNQARPSVAADADGDFTIVWESQGSFRDNSGLSVQSRWYKRDGSAWGDQLQINFWTMSQQDWPVVSSDALGDVVVVWQSVGSYGTDSDNRSVQARLYDGLFRDGFELGDTLRWSDVMP